MGRGLSVKIKYKIYKPSAKIVIMIDTGPLMRIAQEAKNTASDR